MIRPRVVRNGPGVSWRAAPACAPVLACAAALACATVLAVLCGGCRFPSPPAAAGHLLIPVPAPGEARALTDRYGIAHIQAADSRTLYFAWGWVTARDRLWQLEVTKLRAQGQFHTWLGNDALRGDGGAQLFRFEERAAAIWRREREKPEVREALESYAQGVNAYLLQIRLHQVPLPPEFQRLGKQPLEWRPEDSILTLLGLGITLDLDLPELSEADDIQAHGRDWLLARRRFESGWIYDTIPDSAAARMWGAGIAATATAAPAGRTTPAGPASTAIDQARSSLEALRGAPMNEDARASDCIVIGAGRSASGAPLLANDPHLSLRTPGYLHLVHLSVPGICEAAGAAVPGLPAIVSGRNRRCAWGVTALGADVADVVADSISRDGRTVLSRGRWVAVESHPYRMKFRLLGLPLPVLGQFRRYTPEGPVLVWDPKHGRALSLRWTAFADERITLDRLLGIERATSAAEIAARYRSLVTPTINLMAADLGGDARYQSCGLIPRRISDPGPGPLPGGGTSDWPGSIAPDSLPAWRVPPSAFAVNGNNRPLAHYPYALPRYDWAHDRALRMAQRLAGVRKISERDLMSVQNDVWSRGAERALPALLACADSVSGLLDARDRAALDTLRVWDLLARRSRVAPTLFRAWWGAFQRRSRTEGLPGLTLAALAGRAPDAFRAPGGEAAERPALAAVRALHLAFDTLATQLGSDLSRWTWARAHVARFQHDLAAKGGRDAAWEPPLTPEDGDNSSPCVGPSHLPWSVEVTHGPVFRHVVDLANARWSWAVVPPGNRAGTVDLLERWANHGYVPLLLDWSLVEAAATDTVVFRRISSGS